MKLLLVLTAGMLLGSTATAATGWRVFATGTDSGEYGTYASANAAVINPKGLAVRALGPVTEVTWALTCNGETKSAGLANRVVPVTVATAKKCDLYGWAQGDEGTLRVQLLRR